MTPHHYLAPQHVRRGIRRGEIALAGNAVLKIYGRLSCASGKRMNKKNRVFFANLAEATRHGYRPCGHCMRPQYEAWKSARSGLITEGADTTFDTKTKRLPTNQTIIKKLTLHGLDNKR